MRVTAKKASLQGQMPDVYSASSVLGPVAWYAYYGSNIAQLAGVAKRILSIPPKASGGGRNWSAFKHIWSDHRSRLLVGKVGLMVYIYFNQWALKRIKDGPSAADWFH